MKTLTRQAREAMQKEVPVPEAELEARVMSNLKPVEPNARDSVLQSIGKTPALEARQHARYYPSHKHDRRESSGCMEWLGVWNCIFSGSEFSNFGA